MVPIATVEYLNLLCDITMRHVTSQLRGTQVCKEGRPLLHPSRFVIKVLLAPKGVLLGHQHANPAEFSNVGWEKGVNFNKLVQYTPKGAQ